MDSFKEFHKLDENSNMVKIQLLDRSGNWMTYAVTSSTPLMYTMAMSQLEKRFPKYKVRAIDNDGKIVDISG